MQRFRSRQHAFGNRRGQTAVFGALSLTVLFGALGLAVDLGQSYTMKQRLQATADSAASAAATYALNNSDACGGSVTCPATLTCSKIQTPSSSLQVGCDYALTNAPSGATVTLTENNTGLSGNSPKIWIKAVASASNSNVFLLMSGFQTATISAQAYAGVTAFSGAGCIYVLDSTAQSALKATGNTTVSASGCGIYVKSNSSKAIDVEGSSTVNATGGGKVTIECSTCYYTSGTSTVYYVSGSSHLAPVTGTTADPLNLTGPSWSATGCTANPNYTSGALTYNLNPGVYCGGLTIGGNNTVNLAAGTYIMDGGGFSVTNSAKVNGTGVTIYNTSDANHAAGAISFTGNPTVNLTAPTSGTYEGVVLFQDKSNTVAATIANSSNGTITGTYYLPTAALSLTGNVSVATTAAFIVDTLTVTGSSNLSNDPTGKVTGLNKTYSGILQ